MARLTYLDKADLAEEHRDLLDNPANLHRALVYAPDTLRALLGLGRHLRYRSGLDGRLREIAVLLVGYLMRSPYEWTHHLKIRAQFGVTDDDVHTIIAFAEGRDIRADDLTHAVLHAARQLTTDAVVADDVFAVLQEHLPPPHLIDLMATISHYNSLARVISSLRIDLEPAYEPYLTQFPLPQPWR
jgi:alkylhydroperoxidase family enzyme